MTDESLWIGVINGAWTAVHDASLNIDSERWVALFNVDPRQLILYTRWYARCTARALGPKDKSYEAAVNSYREFRTSLSESQIDTLRNDAIRRDGLFEKRLEKIVENHRVYMEKCSTNYLGVREPAPNQKQRSSSCHKCKKGVESHFSPVCEACGWIICDNCGGCGCGWTPRDLGDG